jgi:hypothetical protein
MRISAAVLYNQVFVFYVQINLEIFNTRSSLNVAIFSSFNPNKYLRRES